MARNFSLVLSFAVALAILPFQNCSETLPEKPLEKNSSSTGTVNVGNLTFTASAGKSVILPGAVQPISTQLSSSAPLAAGTVKMTLKNSSGAVILTDSRNFSALAAGQSALQSFTFTSLETLAAGSYSISAEIYQGSSTQPIHTLPNVATFTVQTPVRVSVGNTVPYVDTMGRVWSADFGFTGGIPTTEALPAISNSPDQPLWNSFRWTFDPMTFSTTVPGPGKYKVTLYWVEHYVFAPNLRLFNVAINGNQVLNNVDLFVEAGGAYKVVYRSFIINAATNEIRIDFTHGPIENPKINAIEILGAP